MRFEEHSEKKIGNEDQNIAGDDALGRRLADAGGPSGGLHPFIAADSYEKDAEDERFDACRSQHRTG